MRAPTPEFRSILCQIAAIREVARQPNRFSDDELRLVADAFLSGRRELCEALQRRINAEVGDHMNFAHRNADAAQTPPFDEAVVRGHVEMIHRLAAGIDGELVLATYGEDPTRMDIKTGKPGVMVHKRVDRLRIGDVEETVKGVLGWKGVEHANPYMPLHVVRRGLERGKRGKETDIVAVLGLAADLDADTGKTGTMPIEPSLIIETSPGNYQAIVLFDKPIVPAEAIPLAKALQAATGGDSGTGDIAHVWRVPGTLNWLNAKKVHQRSRPMIPMPVRLVKPWDGSLIAVTAVRDALQPWSRPAGDGGAGQTGGSTDVVAIMARLPKKTQYDIKATPPAGEDRSPHCMRVILSMMHAGLTDDEIKIVTVAYPQGLFGRYREGHDIDGELRRARDRIEKRKAASPSADDNRQLLTEDEAALQFTDRYTGALRYCHDHGAWFQWNGSIWRKNSTCIAFHWARELARRIAADESDKVKVIASKASFSASVERFARADPTFAVTSDLWDTDAFLLGTPAGTVDLRTGMLRAAEPANGITKATAVAPADETRCPRWLKFLSEATGGDAEMIRFTQQWCGYCLTGDTREHALVFVFGDGGNGKSVFVQRRRRYPRRLRDDGRDGCVHRLQQRQAQHRFGHAARRPAGDGKRDRRRSPMG